MILLVHLSGCTQIEEESHISQDLLNQIFNLRISRILSGAIVPTRAMMMSPQQLRSNPRYRILRGFRRRVWNKLGWPTPSRYGISDSRPADTGVMDTTEDGPMQIEPGELFEGSDEHAESATMAEIDPLLSSDPMDLLQWDEWESLASGLFSN